MATGCGRVCAQLGGVGSFESLSALLPSLELRGSLRLALRPLAVSACRRAGATEDARNVRQVGARHARRGARCEVPTVHVLLVRACTASMLLEEQNNWQMAGVALSSGRRTSGCVCRCRTCLYNGGGRAGSPLTRSPRLSRPSPGPVSLLSEAVRRARGPRPHSSRRRGSATTSATLAPGACAST